MTVSLSFAGTDYGTDIPATTDVAPVWGIASGPIVVAYALVRRLGTPRGRLFYDPNYGTDLRAYVNRRVNGSSLASLPTDISSECEKDERVQSTTSAVTFTTQTRTMTVSVQVELITGQTFTMVISATSVTVDLLSINGVAVSATPSLPAGTQLLVGPTGKDGKDGSQGPEGPAGAGGTPQLIFDFDDQDGSDTTGVEQVIAQKYANFTALPGSLLAELGALVYSTAGTGAFKMYVGGTPWTADGTVVATLATTSGTPTGANGHTTGFSNPSGWQLVKVTAKASAAGQTAGISGMTATFR